MTTVAKEAVQAIVTSEGMEKRKAIEIEGKILI